MGGGGGGGGGGPANCSVELTAGAVYSDKLTDDSVVMSVADVILEPGWELKSAPGGAPDSVSEEPGGLMFVESSWCGRSEASGPGTG